MEIWKVIENFEGYMISNFGRVKSLKKNIMLTPSMNNWGYLRVKLSQDGKRYRLLIHRLVLKSFKPNEDLNKTECNHKDGNKENNYVENLEWCTRSDNMKHAFKIGLRNFKGENNPNYGKHPSNETRKLMSEKLRGENHPQSILTEKDVIKIWKYLEEGILTQKQIAEKFGVKQSIISAIKLGQKWKHIKI